MTPPPSPHRWRVLSVLASSLLLIAMDATILTVALPQIAADLEPGATELLWIVDVYGLVLAALLVAMGTLSDRIGRRRLLLIGLAVFGVASAGIALAPSTPALIAARFALGIGGAMVMPSTLSVLRNVFPDDRERAFAIGIWSAVASSGFALGPIVGGAILEVASWPWAFLVNIPIVVVAIALVGRWVPESRNPDPGPWDGASVALSVAGMLALVWGIKHGGEAGFGDPLTLSAVAGGALLLWGFARRQLRSTTPLLDLRLFADRRFSGAVVAVLFVFFGLGAVLLLLTQFLQLVQGLGPLETGLRLLPLALAAGVISPLTDQLSRRLGSRTVIGGSFVLLMVGFAMLASLERGTGAAQMALALAVIGAGAGLAATAGSAAIMAAAPPERAGGAAAVQETAFELGGALGVAMLGTLAATIYRSQLGAQENVPAAAEGLPAAATAAASIGGDAGARLLLAAQGAFERGTTATLVAAAVIMGAVALLSAMVLPGRATAAAVPRG